MKFFWKHQLQIGSTMLVIGGVLFIAGLVVTSFYPVDSSPELVASLSKTYTSAGVLLGGIGFAILLAYMIVQAIRRTNKQ